MLQEATKAGLAELEKLAAPDDPEEIVELLRTRTQERSRAAWERLGHAETETPSAAYSRLRQGMLLAERARVLELRSTGRIPEDVLRNVLESFDVEESVLETLDRRGRGPQGRRADGPAIQPGRLRASGRRAPRGCLRAIPAVARTAFGKEPAGFISGCVSPAERWPVATLLPAATLRCIIESTVTRSSGASNRVRPGAGATPTRCSAEPAPPAPAGLLGVMLQTGRR